MAGMSDLEETMHFDPEEGIAEVMRHIEVIVDQHRDSSEPGEKRKEQTGG